MHQLKNASIYIIFPTVISTTLMAMHFSNIPFLTNLIVPTMPSLHANSWREFGILENLQHIYLLIMLAICIHASRIKEHRLEKYGALLLALFTTFIFLEEIDYGLHYYEWIFGIDPMNRSHNAIYITLVRQHLKTYVARSMSSWPFYFL